MDKRAIPNLEDARCEVDRGVVLSLVPRGLWSASDLLREIALSGAGEQKCGPSPLALMDVKDPCAREAPRGQSHAEAPPAGQTRRPEAPAATDVKNAEAAGRTQVARPARAAADAWSNLRVRGKRGRYSAAVRAVAEQMLIEGASPEEVVQAAHDRGFLRLKRGTVQRWLDQNPQLSEQALRRQAEAAEALRRSLATDLGSPEARLAEAALFAGLSRARKRGSLLAPTALASFDASTLEQLESENRALRRRAENLEQRKRWMTRRIIRARLRLERMRWSLLERQVARLYTAIEGELGGESLAPELLEALRKLRRLTASKRRKSVDLEAAESRPKGERRQG